MASAAYGYFGVGVETVAGTSVAPSKFLPVKNVNFDVQQDEILFREIAGSRQAQQSFAGTLRPSVSFDTAVYPAGATGVVLRGLFGAVATANAGASTTAKTHTFSDAAVLPSLSFERSDVPGAGGLLHERIPGCKIESVSFSAEFGSEVNMSVTAQGLGFPEDPATKPGSITLPTIDPFIFTGVSIDIGGTPSNLFNSIDFEFNNTIEPQEALRGTRSAYKMHEGPMECSISGNVLFEDTVLYDHFKNQTSFAMKVKFEGAVADAVTSTKYAMEFTWPKVKILNFGLNMEAEGVMSADVDFSVSYDKTTSKLVTATMTNLDVANAYNT
jgi:hypothetical protein